MKKILAVLIFSSLLSSTNAQIVWDNLDGGLGSVGPDGVYALLNDTTDGVLYTGGSFTKADNSISCNGFAIWDSLSWSTPFPYLGSGTPNISAFAIYNGKIYGCSSVGTVFLIDSQKIKLVGDFDNSISCLSVYHNKLYAGGKFSEVNGKNAYRIASYDGVKWDSVSGGGVYWSQACCSSVDAMCEWNDKLIVAGTFDRAINDTGEIVTGSIVSWNDTSFTSLGSGMRTKTTGIELGWIYSVCDYKNDLYAGGYFDSAGGNFSIGISKWDGINWNQLGLGLKNPSEIHCMKVKDSSLYIGGLFAGAVGTSNSISLARWDGTNWNSLGDLLENGGELLSLEVYKNELYIGGYFGGIRSGVYFKNIARLVKDTGDEIATVMQLSQFIYYPNPVTDKMNINASEELMQVINVIGQIVITTQLSQEKKETEIDVSNLPQGIYLLRVKTKDGWSMGKFVKE